MKSFPKICFPASARRGAIDGSPRREPWDKRTKPPSPGGAKEKPQNAARLARSIFCSRISCRSRFQLRGFGLDMDSAECRAKGAKAAKGAWETVVLSFAPFVCFARRILAVRLCVSVVKTIHRRDAETQRAMV